MALKKMLLKSRDTTIIKKTIMQSIILSQKLAEVLEIFIVMTASLDGGFRFYLLYLILSLV